MLTIAVEKVCDLIERARAFDVKVDIVEPEPGSNLSDDDMREVLEDYADDPTYQEIKSFIDGLNLDEQIDLVALTWLGRGTYSADEWEDAMNDARDAHNEHTAEYLLGMPMLGDYLEEGLSALDYSCD